MKTKSYKRLLTIAGSDSGGGAGIQADLKTFSALGCFGMSAITAITAQNTVGVTGIAETPPDIFEKQLEAVFEDIGTDAVKIGMLFSKDIISITEAALKKYKPANVVLDPVMISSTGAQLLKDDAIAAMKDKLFPLADIITPNMNEAARLTNIYETSQNAMIQMAEHLISEGTNAVVIKGGHNTDQTSSDLLVYKSETTLKQKWLSSERIETQNNHGTGCTYSSAIASYLADGFSLEQSLTRAKTFITEAIRHGADYSFGKGHGPVHHFYNQWK